MKRLFASVFAGLFAFMVMGIITVYAAQTNAPVGSDVSLFCDYPVSWDDGNNTPIPDGTSIEIRWFVALQSDLSDAALFFTNLSACQATYTVQHYGKQYITARAFVVDHGESRDSDPKGLEGVYQNLISLNMPVSSSSLESDLRSAENAVDGDSTTRWSSQQGIDPQWIAIDLGDFYDVSKVILNWESAFASVYEIQTSDDGAVWDVAHSVTAGDGEIDEIDLSASRVRYIRMYGIERGAPYGYSLWEFQVYGTLSPVLYPPMPPIIINGQ